MKTRAQKMIEGLKERIRESVARHNEADAIAERTLSEAGLAVDDHYRFSAEICRGILCASRAVVMGYVYQLLSDKEVFLEMERCAKPRTCVEIAKFFSPESFRPYSESIVLDAVNWFIETYEELFEENSRHAAVMIEMEEIEASMPKACAKPSAARKSNSL